MVAPRVALVHHWLSSLSGGEQVVLALHDLYPEAPIYTSTYDRSRLPEFAKLDVRTSFLQRWPAAVRRHQLYPWARPAAFESFDLGDYDLVISSDAAEAKGVLVEPGTTHICYCHTPARYYWSDYQAYRARMEFGLLNPLARVLMPPVTSRLRVWDFAAAQRVDHFIANSEITKARIATYYRRESIVIYPPVDVARFTPQTRPGDYLLWVGRLVPYKRVDLAVQAATQLGLPLKVSGEGPERAKLEKLAGPTVEFLGRVGEDELAALYSGASALIFPAEEDFGIVPVEAMAAGLPVIAYGRGGATESVIDGVTGVYFSEQTVASLVDALRGFDPQRFDKATIRARAEEFGTERFRSEITAFVKQALTEP